VERGELGAQELGFADNAQSGSSGGVLECN
jgi:hypothetical protein